MQIKIIRTKDSVINFFKKVDDFIYEFGEKIL